MDLGMVGLGRMGFSMSLRLIGAGHRVIGWNRTPGKAAELAERGGAAARTVEELVDSLAPPRHVWVMVPAGDATGEMLDRLAPLLSPGDVLVDGGNSWYKDTLARNERLASLGIRFLDAGTSGGVWGLVKGYCIMVGGPEDACRSLGPALDALSGPGGWARLGSSGAGHFAKMVHNGIEYGLLQAYGEGFELLAASGYDLDPAAVARLWNHGSVVRSWLLELAESALARDPGLEGVRGWVDDSGEGRWTVLESIERAVPAPAITLALQMRFRSRQEDSFAARLIAALRREFGAHPVKES